MAAATTVGTTIIMEVIINITMDTITVITMGIITIATIIEIYTTIIGTAAVPNGTAIPDFIMIQTSTTMDRLHRLFLT